MGNSLNFMADIEWYNDHGKEIISVINSKLQSINSTRDYKRLCN